MARSNHPNIAVPDAPAAEPAARVSGRRPAVLNLLIALRPNQWTKNLLVFAALIFAQRLFDLRTAAQSVAAFVIFCGLSGVVYLINDVADRDKDRLHPDHLSLKSMSPVRLQRRVYKLRSANLRLKKFHWAHSRLHW